MFFESTKPKQNVALMKSLSLVDQFLAPLVLVAMIIGVVIGVYCVCLNLIPFSLTLLMTI